MPVTFVNGNPYFFEEQECGLEAWHILVLVTIPAVGDKVCRHLCVGVSVRVVGGLVQDFTAMCYYSEVLACYNYK